MTREDLSVWTAYSGKLDSDSSLHSVPQDGKECFFQTWFCCALMSGSSPFGPQHAKFGSSFRQWDDADHNFRSSATILSSVINLNLRYHCQWQTSCRAAHYRLFHNLEFGFWYHCMHASGRHLLSVPYEASEAMTLPGCMITLNERIEEKQQHFWLWGRLFFGKW